NSHEQHSPRTYYQTIKSRKLAECYKTLEAASQINVIECENQKVNMSTRNVLNNTTKVNKGNNLNGNDLQEMCITWMDKIARIKDSPSLKQHAGKVDDSIIMVKCKDSGNSQLFLNNKVENIKLHVMNDLIIKTRSADKDRIDNLVERLFKKNNLGD
ncbi:10453_t:CDS:2, partial [Racocetra fulgida]